LKYIFPAGGLPQSPPNNFVNQKNRKPVTFVDQKEHFEGLISFTLSITSPELKFQALYLLHEPWP